MEIQKRQDSSALALCEEEAVRILREKQACFAVRQEQENVAIHAEILDFLAFAEKLKEKKAL